MKRITKIVAAVSGCMVICAAIPVQGGLVPISDYGMLQTLERFEVTFAPVDLNLGGQTRNTGPITARLDPALPGVEGSFLWYDLGTGAAWGAVTLEVNCPLFATLQVPTQRMGVYEYAGPNSYSVTPAMVSDTDWTDIDLNWQGHLGSYGWVEEGQFMSGWEYRNFLGGCDGAKVAPKPLPTPPPPPPTPPPPPPQQPPPTTPPVRPLPPPRTPRASDWITDPTLFGTIQNPRLFSPTGDVYPLTVVSVDMVVTQVPEPASALALLAGCVMLTRRR